MPQTAERPVRTPSLRRLAARVGLAVVASAAVTVGGVAPAGAAGSLPTGSLGPGSAPGSSSGSLGDALGSVSGTDLRVATYNVAMNRSSAGELLTDLSTPDDPQIGAVAAIIQANDPDIVLVNEFDHDPTGRSADLFRSNYLEVPRHGQEPVEYPYAYSAPVNTGVPSGMDLNDDGRTDGPDDAYGFGFFPGQYGMLLLSKYPIDTAGIRTFQKFLWTDMPDNLIPRDYYGANSDRLRLSSKSHWDVPVSVDGRPLHVLAAHPTPPAFDGPEQRNKRRNHDEIRMWADYVTGGEAAGYLYDDEGVRGGLSADAGFVVMGDYNSDPLDGDSWPGAIDQLLDHPRIVDTLPASAGGAAAADEPGNRLHRNPPEYDTADFSDPQPGNLRVDYVLPSTGLPVHGSGVFWPVTGEPLAELMPPDVGSDHRLVWVDLTR